MSGIQIPTVFTNHETRVYNRKLTFDSSVYLS
jgi:hypothetical protein